MRRQIVFSVMIITAVATTARAQTPPSPAASSHGYVEGVAQSAFGNVTSQSYGGEIGIWVAPGLQVFVEGGAVRNAAPADLTTSAALIASAIQGQFTAKEPLTFGLAGLRFLMGSSGSVQPYLLGGAGIARMKKEVAFTVNGSDVTNSIQQFGVVLGTDLSGSETKPMLTVGGGVAWTVWKQLMIDFQYRYGRVLKTDERINLNRAGAGIGIRF
jgi:opacity protein-like surface antigen